jgi:hypothetical protein
MRRLRRRPALWAVLALVALLVGLAGSSAAAPLAKVPKSLVADVKKALKLGKSADKRSRKALKEAKAARANSGPGAQGAQGLPGATGPQGDEGERGLPGGPGKPGSGLGYAQIEYCATAPCEDFNSVGWFSSDDTNSPGIDNTVNFQTDPTPHIGVFCYRALPFTPHVVMANIGTVGDATAQLPPYLVSARAGSDEHKLPECNYPVGIDNAKTAAIYVRDLDGNLVEPDHGLRIWVLFG